MTLQKKEPAQAASAGGDEIDEIMNEIEELQQSMSASQATPGSARGKAESASVEEPSEPNVMEEFQGSSGDVSMEETLANLKDDEPSGPNLIDQAMEAEAAAKAGEEDATAAELEEVQEEVESELEEAMEEDELLDEAEAEALDDAVAEAEEAAILAANAQGSEEEEEVPMSEAPRRGRSSSGQPTVSVKLTGEMLLRLSYEFEGQEVLVSFADGSLRVELSDGTEFKIPVRRAPLRKAA